MALAPRSLVHNWKLKLSALGLSVFLWALVQTEPRNAETLSAVPVVVAVSDTSWTLATDPTPSTVELRLSGPAREIIRLARDGTTIRVPVLNVGSPDTLITLRRDWVVLGDGSGLGVESVTPPTIQLTFEPAQRDLLPITIPTVGALADQLALAAPIGLNPTVVVVRGRASVVDALDSIPLMPLDLSTVTGSGVLELPIDTSGLYGTRVTPAVATVGLRVEDVLERVLSGVPVIARVEDGEAAIVVTPDAVEVTLRGARTLVTAVDPVDLRVWIAPEDLRDMAVDEERRVPIRVEGVPDLVTAELPSETVTVRRAADQTLEPPSGL